MEMNPTKLLRKRRPAAEIALLVREQEQSNCTVKKFCAERDINEGTFFNWRKRYGKGLQAGGDFISLQVNKEAVSPVFAEIEHSSKAVIRLFRPVDASYLKALL